MFDVKRLSVSENKIKQFVHTFCVFVSDIIDYLTLKVGWSMDPPTFNAGEEMPNSLPLHLSSMEGNRTTPFSRRQ